jgi:hypothetical protein
LFGLDPEHLFRALNQALPNGLYVRICLHLTRPDDLLQPGVGKRLWRWKQALRTWFEFTFAVVPGCDCLPVPKIPILSCVPSYLLKPLWFMNSQMRPIQV